MPLVRIDLIEGKSEEYRAKVGDVVYQSLFPLHGCSDLSRVPQIRVGIKLLPSAPAC